MGEAEDGQGEKQDEYHDHDHAATRRRAVPLIFMTPSMSAARAPSRAAPGWAGAAAGDLTVRQI